MATGIISNAFFFEDRHVLSDILFAVALTAYLALVALTLWRAVRFPVALWGDLVNPRLVFAFFTFVAATDVFGAGVDLRGFPGIAMVLWWIAFLAWVLLTYFGFAVFTFRNSTAGADVVHGGWLIAIVGTESLVILGTMVAPGMGDLSGAVFVLIYMLWGVGLGLYGIMVTLFAYRAFFFEVRPEDLAPPLWIIMGAAAISANAGSALILADSGLPFLEAMRPLIDGLTLVLWAWATWWIPLLVLFGIWTHAVRAVPLSYTPQLWSLVFPLGMYALASLRLSLASDFAPTRTISHVMLWIALGAWIATATGLVAANRRSLREFKPAA